MDEFKGRLKYRLEGRESTTVAHNEAEEMLRGSDASALKFLQEPGLLHVDRDVHDDMVFSDKNNSRLVVPLTLIKVSALSLPPHFFQLADSQAQRDLTAVCLCSERQLIP